MNILIFPSPINPHISMEFEVLKELAKTVTRNKIKHIEVLGNSGNRGSQVEQFHEVLINDKFNNEKELVRYFYKSHDPRHIGYQKLKKKLIQNLVNTAFFVDINQAVFNERAKAYFTGYKDFAAAVILVARSASKSGIYLLQSTLEQAMKYEFIDLAADCAKILRREFARSGCDIEKNQYYAKIHQEYEEKRFYENKAFDYYETLVSYYTAKRSPSQEIFKVASRYHEELLPLLEKVNTSFFYSFFYNIKLIKHISMNEYKNALSVVEDALSILRKKQNTNRDSLHGFTLQKIALYVQIRYINNTEIESLMDYCLSIAEVGSFNWFRDMETYFYYSMLSRQFSQGLNTYDKIVKCPAFVLLDGSFHDNWLLMGGYLHLLSQLNVLPKAEVEAIVGKFRYSKLINDIEILKKDKEGMNIPLLLLPILYELAHAPQERTKEIPIEALDKYRQRWLANDMNRRSNSFLKILLVLAQSAGTGTVKEKKIIKEWEILKSETPEVAGQSFAIEIVPYETLFELLLAKMGLKSLVHQLFPPHQVAE